MKKIFLLLSISIMIGSLTSCVTSLQPLMSHDKITTDQRIVGTWAGDEDEFKITPFMKSEFAKQLRSITGKSNDKPFVFSGESKQDSILFNNLYIVSFQKQGVMYNMIAGLVRLGNDMFLDLYPAAMNDSLTAEAESDPFGFNNNYLAGYTMAKIEFSSNSNINMTFIDGSFVKEQVLAGRMRLKHESNELFDTFIITASTRELQQFVQKYANDGRVFNQKNKASFNRKPLHL